MKIEVISIVDEPDGGATINFEIDEEARNVLVKEGLMAILKRAAKKTKGK